MNKTVTPHCAPIEVKTEMIYVNQATNVPSTTTLSPRENEAAHIIDNNQNNNNKNEDILLVTNEADETLYSDEIQATEFKLRTTVSKQTTCKKLRLIRHKLVKYPKCETDTST